jgi:hypothetical protein
MEPIDVNRWLEENLPLSRGLAHRYFTGLANQLDRLEAIVAHSKDEVLAALDGATTEVANDLQGLRDQLSQAIADKGEAVQAAVEDVLAGFDAPIARLQALGSDPQNPVPDPEPTPEPAPEPAPDQPLPDEPAPDAPAPADDGTV